MLDGLRAEESVSELCRREGITESVYCRWSKEFLEVGKSRLAENTKQQVTGREMRNFRQENGQSKQLMAELSLASRDG